MGVAQNTSLSLADSQPEVWEWDPDPELSSVFNSTIVLLGVLTFGLQLCLAVFFLLKCWSYDKRIQETIKNPATIEKLDMVPPDSCLLKDIKKLQNQQQHCDVEAAQSAAPKSTILSGASSYYDNEEYGPTTNYLSAPFIAWDIGFFSTGL